MSDNMAVASSVSVQICTLNEAANIGECLEAVLANDPAEVIVIDGGSTDATVEIAEDLGARVLSPGRLGLGHSRQLGYMSTDCTYSAFIDADDRIEREWISTMLREMVDGGYAALQSSLRAIQTGSWWSRGWNEYFIESVRPTADTIMVGRPAMFLTEALQRNRESLPSLDEDTHLSRWFQEQGFRQGIGSALAYRHVEETAGENFRKWQSYGRGYRGFLAEHPERRGAMVRHVAVTIPIIRGWRPVLRGQILQPAFTGLMATHIAYGWLRGAGSLETPRLAGD